MNGGYKCVNGCFYCLNRKDGRYFIAFKSTKLNKILRGLHDMTPQSIRYFMHPNWRQRPQI
jgi:hypothetical protein